MTKALPLLLMISALAAGCGPGAREAGPVPTATSAAEAQGTEPTASSGQEGETNSEPAQTDAAPIVCEPQIGGEDGVFTNLTHVRVGAHDGFDRIVFEFSPPQPNPGGEAGIPRYEIRQANPPFTEDPSGEPLDVFGDAFVRLAMQGAAGYDFDGNPTYAGSHILTPGFGTLAQAVEGGDFEATMTWVLGLSRPTCWQVQELHNPDRLVVDFHHV